MHRNVAKLLVLIVICGVSIAFSRTMATRVLADCTTNGDHTDCSGDLTTDVTGSDNDETITVDANTNYNDHQVDGGVGNDTITAAANDSSGSRVRGGEGDDSITIGSGNGTITVVGGDGGSDTLIINGGNVGTVASGDDPDGSDLITIGGNSSVGLVLGGNGNDTLNLNDGTVGTIYTGPGNDLISLGDGAVVTGSIMGEDAFVTLAFKFTTHSAQDKQDFQNQLDTITSGGGGSYSGSVSWNGQSYSFTSIEELQNLITILQAAHHSSGGGSSGAGAPVNVDGRLDPDPAAPAVTFCSGGEIQVYAADGSGLIIAAHVLDLAAGQTASAANIVISYDPASGNVIVSVNGGAYTYTFPGVACAG